LDKAKQLAEYEIGWWQCHHRKDIDGSVQNMARLYKLQFGITIEQALECVKLRVEAGKEHDKAESFEDSGNQNMADLYWGRAEILIEKHFEILLKTQESNPK